MDISSVNIYIYITRIILKEFKNLQFAKTFNTKNVKGELKV